MSKLDPEILHAAAQEREVTLTTLGRKTGRPSEVVIWITTDGKRLFIRSGKGLARQWPQNFLARGEATIGIGDAKVRVKPRLVTDPREARAVSLLYRNKYGESVKPSASNEPLTEGEKASFELLPAS
jgi:deazaflavin-dependent oxidoreductase (nitroreductase family)